MDCFALLAMTVKYGFAISPQVLRELCRKRAAHW